MHGDSRLREAARLDDGDEGTQQIDIELRVHDLSIQLMEFLNFIRLSR
jgi:hypothetical protein